MNTWIIIDVFPARQPGPIDGCLETPGDEACLFGRVVIIEFLHVAHLRNTGGQKVQHAPVPDLSKDHHPGPQRARKAVCGKFTSTRMMRSPCYVRRVMPVISTPGQARCNTGPRGRGQEHAAARHYGCRPGASRRGRAAPSSPRWKPTRRGGQPPARKPGRNSRPARPCTSSWWPAGLTTAMARLQPEDDRPPVKANDRDHGEDVDQGNERAPGQHRLQLPGCGFRHPR